MNTPDTEWEEGLQDIMESYIMTAELGHLAKDELKHKEELRAYWKELNDFITNLISSRDTYWKERVEEVLKKAVSDGACGSYKDGIRKVLSTFTNKDDLK